MLRKIFTLLAGAILLWGNVQADSFTQRATLTPTLPGITNFGDSFGQFIFQTSKYLFIGAPIATVNDTKLISGAVYVYKKNDETNQWERTQIITSGGLLDHLSATKIYSKDHWLFVSAIGTPIGPIADDIPANQDFTGAVLIYKREHGSDQWVFFQALDRTTPGLEDLTVCDPGAVTIPPVPFLQVENGATFGSSFDLNLDKGLLLVGAPGQRASNESPINSGAVYAFKLHHGRWELIQKFTNPDGITENDSFGGQVVIYGKYALISNTLSTTPHINTNSSVYLYRYKRGQWNFIQKVDGDPGNTLVEIGVFNGTTPFELSPNFGASIVAKDGWALIGAPYENLGTNQLKGAVYFYRFINIGEDGKRLQRVQKFVSDDPNTLFTGISVGLDDCTAVAGDPGRTGPNGEQAQGGLLVFRRFGNFWYRQPVLFDQNGFPFQLFGNGSFVRNKYIVGGVGDAVIGEIILTAVPPLLPLPTPLAENRAIIWKR